MGVGPDVPRERRTPHRGRLRERAHGGRPALLAPQREPPGAGESRGRRPCRPRPRLESDGQLAIENYVGGQRTGLQQTWHTTGLRKGVGTFVGDQLDGERFVWDEAGQLMEQLSGVYEKGRKVGPLDEAARARASELAGATAPHSLESESPDPFLEYDLNGELRSGLSSQPGRSFAGTSPPTSVRHARCAEQGRARALGSAQSAEWHPRADDDRHASRGELPPPHRRRLVWASIHREEERQEAATRS